MLEVQDRTGARHSRKRSASPTAIDASPMLTYRSDAMSRFAVSSATLLLTSCVLLCAAVSCSAAPSTSQLAAPSASNVPFSLHVIDGNSGHGIVIKSNDHEIVIDGGGDQALEDYVRKTDLINDPIELAVVMDSYAG